MFAPVSLDQPADIGEVAPLLAAVVPPALDAPHVELAALRVDAVDVGDLELAAARRRERVDDVEDVRRVAVEPDDRVVRRRRVVAHVDDAGLLDDVGDLPVLVVGDDAEVLRIGDLLGEDERAVVPAPDRVRLAVLEDVVAEAHDELIAAANSRAIPTTCAIPPASVCTL